MRAGDSFFSRDRFGMRHLYVVISDPTKLDDTRFAGYVFLVMLSTREHHKEDACVLKQGDHPFIDHDTVAVYRVPPALFGPLSDLQKSLDSGALKPSHPVSAVVLKRLREGYLKSRYQKDTIFQFLYRQGVIE